MKDLPEEQVSNIRKVIDQEGKVEGDLKKEVSMNIKRLMDIGSYRGQRHGADCRYVVSGRIQMRAPEKVPAAN